MLFSIALESFNNKSNYHDFCITPLWLYNGPFQSSWWESLLRIFRPKWVKSECYLFELQYEERISAVWAVSSLSTLWTAKNPRLLQFNSEDRSDFPNAQADLSSLGVPVISEFSHINANYRICYKYSDILTLYDTCFLTLNKSISFSIGVRYIAGCVGNCVAPDQTSHVRRPIWVCTVCSSLFDRIFCYVWYIKEVSK